MPKQKQDNNAFATKYAKRLTQEFIDAVEQMDTEAVKERIITCEGHLCEIEGAKANDTKLAEVKEKSKELSAPYRDSLKEETAKLKYCLFVLEQRGVDISG